MYPRRFDPVRDAAAAKAIREANEKKRMKRPTCRSCRHAKVNSCGNLNCMVMNRPVSLTRIACSLHQENERRRMA